MFFNKDKKKINFTSKKIIKIKKYIEDYNDFDIENLLVKHKNLENNFILESAIAVIYSVIKIKNKIDLHDNQIMASILMFEGNIVEMSTGEGKTYSSIVTTYLYILNNKKLMFIATANNYLAERDSELSNDILSIFDYKANYITDNMNYDYKRNVYKNSNVVYSKMNTLIFDYLRNNLFPLKEMIFFNSLDFIIIDEVDFSLIDEARTPMIISKKSDNSELDYITFNNFVKNKLNKNDFFLVDDKTKDANLNESGLEKLEEFLIDKKIITDKRNLYIFENNKYINLVNNSLLANHLYKENIHYLIKENSLCVIDQKTGRTDGNSKFSAGLQQAIEAKESLKISEINDTMSSITVQNFVKKFTKLSGMTGTIKTDEKEITNVYNINVYKIPDNKKSKRIDSEDLVFFSLDEKEKYLIELVKESSEDGRPILIGVNDVETSEKLSTLFSENKIEHELLNAKNHLREAEIIRNAGCLNSIVISTNMAGRGTDIKLGGDEGENLEKIKDLGGLLVIGFERSELQRLDNQLKGRCGRQGDEGEVQFLISLDDNLLTSHVDNTGYKKIFSRLGLEKGYSKNKMISGSISKIQKKVDGFHSDSRKNLLIFDNIIDKQRDIYLNLRKKIIELDTIKVKTLILNIVDKYINSTTDAYFSEYFDDNRIIKYQNKINKELKSEIDISNINEVNEIKKIIIGYYSSKIEILLKNKNASDELRSFTLGIIDNNWSIYLNNIESIRATTSLRSYAQEKPLDEYKKETFNSFENMIIKNEEDIFKNLLNFRYTIEISNLSLDEFIESYPSNYSRTYFGTTPFIIAGI